ncbi:ribonuclease H-like domain-containing protein [Tanacetum coccineum]
MPVVTQGVQNVRRSSRQSVFPKNYNDFVVESKVKYGLEKYVGYSKLNSENFCFVTQLNKTREPKTYFEASKYSHWTDAMNQEMDALLRNDTWELVDLPGRKAIRSKWIYKIKFRSSDEIDRYKARLVAQGFGQKEGFDYEDTFSLVVKMVTVRCLLNVVVSMSWPVFQLDVNNAFLYGDLEEVVFMKPPEGYFPSNNKVCRLKKSLYGLKQAPRQWNAKLTSTLIENEFRQSKSDYSLYTKSDKGVFLALLVYVDDIIITGNSVSEIEKFKVFLKSKFMIKDLGKLKYFLGIEVVDTDKGICLHQRKYVLDLLSEYGMLACKPAKTPLMSKLVISNEASDKDPLLENITDYQKLMGKLIYLTNTRPYISYAVHCLSQFMHSSLTSHLKIAFKILRYLKSCPGLGVHVTKTSGMLLTAYSDVDWAKCIGMLALNPQTPLSQFMDSPLSSHLKTAFKILRYLKSCSGLGIHIARTSGMFLNAYFDADWARCIVTRKSVTEYCVFLNNSLVSWKNILTKGLDTIQHLELVKRLSFRQGLAAFDQRLKDEGLLLPSVDSYKSVWSRCYKSVFPL